MVRWSLLAAAFSGILASQEARAATPPDSLAEIRRQIEALTEEIERLKLGEVDETSYRSLPGLGPAASKVYSLKKSGVSIAGYGEVLYENYATERDNGTASTTKDKIDYLRNIIYVGYRFSDLVVFNSEVEFEHGSTGKGGEVSVEFGYIDLLLSPRLNVRAGMVLAPVGIVNEGHEPPTFFGTLRTGVERFIIPSTWRVNGAGLYGEATSGLHYRAYVVEGLKMASFSSGDGIRGGRQSGASAVAADLAFTGRLEYLGIEGASFGASFYTGNSGQGEKDSLGAVINARTNVISVHGEVAWRGLEVRALVAQTSVDEAERISGYQRWKVGSPTTPVIGSTMSGWYVSAGYDVMPLILPGTVHSLAPYVLYETYDTQAAVPTGMSKSAANDRSTLVAGVTWKPHPNVAFKADWRDNKNGAGTGTDQWNLAVTYLY
jgi:hypothetical protein